MVTIHITILNNTKENFDTATTTTDNSMGFDTNVINLVNLLFDFGKIHNPLNPFFPERCLQSFRLNSNYMY